MKKRVFINKLKNNKVKIAVFSGLMATAIGLSTGLGIYATSKSVEQTEYLYQKGVVKFDSNGKLLIPKVVDPNNPSGIYEHMPEPIDNIKVDEELINDQEILADIDKEVKDAFKEYKKLFDDILDKEVVISKDVKMLFNNLVPSMKISENEKIVFDKLLDEVLESAKQEAITKKPDSQYISDLCAINGINFNKFYNELNSTPTIQLYGGPGIPDADEFDNVNPNDLNQSFGGENQKEKLVSALIQDYKTRYKLAVSNTTILITLTAISAVLTILSFITAGFSTLALIQMLVDIASTSYTVTMSWIEYVSSHDALTNLSEIIDISKKETKLEEITDVFLMTGDFLLDGMGIIDNISEINLLRKKCSNFHIFFDRAKGWTNIHILKLSIISSIFSIIATTVLTILEKTLIKYEIPLKESNKK